MLASMPPAPRSPPHSVGRKHTHQQVYLTKPCFLSGPPWSWTLADRLWGKVVLGCKEGSVYTSILETTVSQPGKGWATQHLLLETDSGH